MLLVFAGLVALFFLLNFLFPVPDRIRYSTVITDRDGEIIHAYLTPDEKWRMRLEPGDISPLMQKTIIAREDRRFLAHSGVDFLALGRAFFNNLFTINSPSPVPPTAVFMR